MNDENSAWIVRALSEPSFYDHPVDTVQLIETHISWVFLAGDFAYKVKKPLDLGFLDYSTLEKRRHFCRKELDCNRHFAEQLYLAVVQIGGSPEKPQLNGLPALEYAVKMRRFPCDCQLDRMLASNLLHESHLVAFAELLAKLHGTAQPAPADSPYGTPDAVIEPILENFRQVRPLVAGSDRDAQLTTLETQAKAGHRQLAALLAARKAAGFVRACHGDVHLANMAWFEDQPLLFDCIEFNDNLRLIDVVNDVAFLVMDLDDRLQSPLGWLFLNRYLQQTGDYQGLTLLNFYKTYRAMVRAKVTGLRLAQGHFDSDEQRQQVERLFYSYLDLAEEYSHEHRPILIITHGYSGAGKSTFAAQLANRFGAIHLRSDVERKRLHGLAATELSGSPIDGGIYSAEAFAATYQRLAELAEVVLQSGIPVIVDATFLKRQQRALFADLAERLQRPLVVLDFPRTDPELHRLLEQRALELAKDASEADLEVLQFQQQHAEPLVADEQLLVLEIALATDVTAVAQELTALESSR